ncbi:hypothetical protein E4T66_16815 [Sinimarinibacterium sp. CAU 1509]|uniref:porin n=1 Tax=Sinimarinibacterium sp. CAU 1509 TaxID=2562283 RepID=UPI0010AD4770|nr:porin [Sinimarinibacterium sp. CAU 1509]TJY58350.1 hypothetical protein E4T66_16815 [Sinimarinibacterium sp. CAU 1509]
MSHRRFQRWQVISAQVLGTVACCIATTVQAAPDLQYQLHGFAAQAYALSDGNNYVGDSLDGSLDFYELGLNGSAGIGPVTVSAQGLVRRFGEQDSGDLRLDYGFLDYRAVSTMDATAGVRLGRVKNYYGLFNDTRDVVFTRPGIMLPSSVYFEGTGIRSILFSSDGGQLYGGYGYGDHYISLNVTLALDDTASADEKRTLFGGGTNFPGDLQINDLTVARLMDEWGGGTWRAALSFVHGKIAIDPAPGVPISGAINTDLYVASLRHSGEKYAITTEYIVASATGQSNPGGRIDSKSDGLYVQLDYRVTEQWTGMLRYDLYFADRNDRNGNDYVAETGGDRHSRYSRDLTFGVNWLPDPHWGVWAEYHLIQGSATTPRTENQGRSIESDGSLLLLMVGYHF